MSTVFVVAIVSISLPLLDSPFIDSTSGRWANKEASFVATIFARNNNQVSNCVLLSYRRKVTLNGVAVDTPYPRQRGVAMAGMPFQACSISAWPVTKNFLINNVCHLNHYFILCFLCSYMWCLLPLNKSCLKDHRMGLALHRPCPFHWYSLCWLISKPWPQDQHLHKSIVTGKEMKRTGRECNWKSSFVTLHTDSH